MAVVSDTAPAPSAAAATASASGGHGTGKSPRGVPTGGVKGAWSQVVRGEAPPQQPTVDSGSRSDAPPAEVQPSVVAGPKQLNSEKAGAQLAGDASASKGMEEPVAISSKIEKSSSEGEQLQQQQPQQRHPEAESSTKGELGQTTTGAGDHVVKPAKPAWKNASSTLGKTPATGPVMGAVTWPTLGDARQSKTVMPSSEQPLKNHPTPVTNPTSQQVCTWA